jgi:hypothetical protein
MKSIGNTFALLAITFAGLTRAPINYPHPFSSLIIAGHWTVFHKTNSKQESQ